MVRDITIIALMAAVLLIQETALSFVAGVQLTFLLIMVYSRVFGLKRTFFIILIHVLLDNLVMGSFNILTILPMLISYSLIPLSLTIIKTDKSIILAFISILYAFIYCWIFIPFSMIILEVNFVTYIKADIVFELIMASCNFILVLWLFNPLKKVLDEQYAIYKNKEE